MATAPQRTESPDDIAAAMEAIGRDARDAARLLALTPTKAKKSAAE